MEHNHWARKWRRQLETLATEGLLLQFRYEQVYRVLEYFLFSKKLKNLRFLEVGCGRGITSTKIMTAVPEVKMCLADLSIDAIRLTKNKLVQQNLEAFGVVANTHSLPFKDKAFSMVFSIGLLEHFADPAPSVREQCRVLNRKGLWMALVIPMKFSINSLVSTLYRKQQNLFRNSLLDGYYETVLTERANMGHIECVYLDPFFTAIKGPTINRILVFIYQAIVGFRKFCLFQKFPFSAHRWIGRSFFVAARKGGHDTTRV